MKQMIVVRGGGDIATGTIHRLHRAGYRVLVLELENPSAIRRRVAFCEAVFENTVTVEGVTCRRADSLAAANQIMESGEVALLVDAAGTAVETLKPKVLIDAILAKKNLGTNRRMAEFTIALGPGFSAGQDVDCVIETMALYEDVVIGETGRIANNSFMQYRLPSRLDIGRRIAVEFESSYEPTGPFGAKSIGEVVINTPSPAIADAVYNATGVRIRELPITPEKIFMGMQSKK